MFIDEATGKVLVLVTMFVVSGSLVVGSRHQPFPEISGRFGWLLLTVAGLVALGESAPRPMPMVTMLTLTLGTISLSLLGSIGAALTVGLHRGTALLSLLILPLSMPVLIIGANTVSLAAGNETYSAGVWALAAYAVGALSLAPYATAAALRISNE